MARGKHKKKNYYREDLDLSRIPHDKVERSSQVTRNRINELDSLPFDQKRL
jgi:hypothetical protein